MLMKTRITPNNINIYNINKIVKKDINKYILYLKLNQAPTHKFYVYKTFFQKIKIFLILD